MPIYSLGPLAPSLGNDVYVAPTGIVIGDVTLDDQSSVWFGTVIRGDVHKIRIGARTNIQDNSLVHVVNDIWSTTIGDDVTVGHSVIVHGCTIGHRCLIGMGSTILDGAVVGDDAIVGAGALVTPRMVVPPKTVVMGRPAKVIREATEEDLFLARAATLSYVENGARFAKELKQIG